MSEKFFYVLPVLLHDTSTWFSQVSGSFCRGRENLGQLWTIVQVFSFKKSIF